MSRTTITIDAEQDTVNELDRIASTLHLDRGEVIREALESYIAWDQDFRASVEAGIREADAGLLIDHSEVVEMIRNLELASAKRRSA